MPTHLKPSDHIDAIRLGGATLRAAVVDTAHGTVVPTCDEWDVGTLVGHVGTVHRWAAAKLRGDDTHRTEDSEAEAATTPDLLAWFTDGLDALVETLHATPDDAKVMVFLADAPQPRPFWARRQAHETTIHAVDAVSASLGRRPSVDDVAIPAALAADGVDELLTGFVPRRRTQLRSDEPLVVGVRATDTGHAWSLRISADPVVTTPGAADVLDGADALLSGTAAQLYLGLWNRGDEISAEGRTDVLDLWRAQMRVIWR